MRVHETSPVSASPRDVTSLCESTIQSSVFTRVHELSRIVRVHLSFQVFTSPLVFPSVHQSTCLSKCSRVHLSLKCSRVHLSLQGFTSPLLFTIVCESSQAFWPGNIRLKAKQHDADYRNVNSYYFSTVVIKALGLQADRSRFGSVSVHLSCQRSGLRTLSDDFTFHS